VVELIPRGAQKEEKWGRRRSARLALINRVVVSDGGCHSLRASLILRGSDFLSATGLFNCARRQTTLCRPSGVARQFPSKSLEPPKRGIYLLWNGGLQLYNVVHDKNKQLLIRIEGNLYNFNVCPHTVQQ
jgi:hypothetical protein